MENTSKTSEPMSTLHMADAIVGFVRSLSADVTQRALAIEIADKILRVDSYCGRQVDPASR